MATRKVWYGLSALLMIVSLASFFGRGLNLAIDFTGGVSAEASFPGAANVDAVRTRLAAAGFRDPQVEVFGSSRDIAIRLPPDPKQTGAEVRARLETALKAVDAGAQVVQLDVVGPQVGNELRMSAIWALFFTMLGDLSLYRLPLSHLAAVARRDPRGAARSDPGAGRSSRSRSYRSTWRWSRRFLR